MDGIAALSYIVGSLAVNAARSFARGSRQERSIVACQHEIVVVTADLSRWCEYRVVNRHSESTGNTYESPQRCGDSNLGRFDWQAIANLRPRAEGNEQIDHLARDGIFTAAARRSAMPASMDLG